MARPKAHAHMPSFRFGTAVEFLIRGKNFVGDGAGHVTVSLTSDDGYTWAPNNPVGTVIDAHWVRVSSTPHDGGRHGAGVGDLTVTVTNGDGASKTNTYSQDVYYG